jgi:hypothetical protein
MDSPVLVAYFDDISAGQFKNSDRTALGHSKRINKGAGTITVLANKDTRSIFGLTRLKNAPFHDTPCIENLHLDAEIYTGKYAKYNKWRIYVEDVKFFANPITYDWIRNHLGVPSAGGKGNMWENNMLNYCPPFHKDVDITIVNKYVGLVNSWMNVIA